MHVNMIFREAEEAYYSRGRAPVAQWVKRWPTDLAARV